jgi:hypothetical protein
MGFRDELRGEIPGSTAVTVPMLAVAYPATVAVIPASGCSIYTEYTVDGGTWASWTNGTATAFSVDVLDSAVKALRFSRTAGAATTSVYMVLPERQR